MTIWLTWSGGLCSHINVSKNYISLSGWQVSEESLNEVAELSGVLQEGSDFLPQDVRAECERIIPEVDKVQPRDAADTYLFLKAHCRV